MATVAHPVFKDQTHYVEDADLESWVSQGWVEQEGGEQAGPVLTSFEQKLLEQEKQEVDGPPVEQSTSFQPNLTNDTIPEEG